MAGEPQVLDAVCPADLGGILWFAGAATFAYYKDAERTRTGRSPSGRLRTVGDIGCFDADGYPYLTDRKTFMIIPGGVSIYPQESDDVLITHPKVADAAVFGVPNEDLGEEVKAVVQLIPGEQPGPAVAQELIDHCRAHLAHLKCPRHRFRGGTATLAGRQAVQAPIARLLLGVPCVQDRVRGAVTGVGKPPMSGLRKQET